MRKLASLGVGLAIACTYVASTAGPAAAIPRHHHHHHHHTGGRRGPTCGAGTVNVSGVCTPSGTGPSGDSNVVITPNNITMTLNGDFSTTVVVKGLSPLSSGFVDSDALTAACTAGLNIFVVGNTAGLTGEIVVSISGSGCVPGTYPIVITQISDPVVTFTGFITLHF